MISKEQNKITSLRNKKNALKARIAKQEKYITELEGNLRNTIQTLKRHQEKIAEARNLLKMECCICLETIETVPKFGYLCKDHPLHIDCFVRHAYHDKPAPQTVCPICRAGYDPNVRFENLLDDKEENKELENMSPLIPLPSPLFCPEVIELNSEDEKELPCAQDPYDFLDEFHGL